MENLSKFYINGQWVSPLSSDHMPIVDPATEEQIGTLPLGNRSDVDRAVSAAKTALRLIPNPAKLIG